MLAPIQLTKQQVHEFNENGFVVLHSILDNHLIEQSHSRFEKLFAGFFETDIQPDEWNWKAGLDDATLTRQICNAWKSDLTIASIVLRADIGAACALLRNWVGARINQDNIIWKPPGARALGFHQDDSYQNWIVPSEMMTCWITLDDTFADYGTIEYVRGSHRWPVSPPIQQFHAPDDPLIEMQRAAACVGATVDIVPIEVPAGSAVLHHGRTWHGSRANCGSAPRRSVVAHCVSSEAVFHKKNSHAIYSRYKKHQSQEMDESFFPITWRSDGYRSAWIDDFLTARE